MARDARVGNTINLRTKFVDDLNDAIEATSVAVYIFEPDVDYSVIGNAVETGVPTYLGNGVYEYNYDISPTAPAGEWTDRWIGTIPDQTLDTHFNFNVTDSGLIEEFPDQLFQNNVVTVAVASGIQAYDGTTLVEPFSFSFLTITNPTYSSIRKLRLEYGNYFSDIEDDTLQLSLFEASLEADELTFATTLNIKVYEHARREWVTCKAALMLMNNIGSILLKSKTLGDFTVSYDTNGLRDAMRRALDCMDKWEGQIISGGYAKASQNPVGVVKGEFDPDRPAVGRSWGEPGVHGEDDSLPAANTKVPGYRRYEGVYSRNRKRYW